MATKNINLLKQAIFTLLNGDSTLRNLLGRTGRIHHQYPPQKASYPHVLYEIITDVDHPFDEDNTTGEITETIVGINIFSITTGSTESDNIESRVKVLLHKKHADLTNTNIMCYSSLRTGMPTQRMDDTHRTWITQAQYSIRWATK